MTTVLELKEPLQQGRQKSSYLKMDYSFMEELGFKEWVRELWEIGLRSVEGIDSRVIWENTWKKVKRLFSEEKKQCKLANLEISTVQEELQRIRALLTLQDDPDLIKRLSTLEAEVRASDRREAIIWHKRNRVRWLVVGDAPSRYFFRSDEGKMGQ